MSRMKVSLSLVGTVSMSRMKVSALLLVVASVSMVDALLLYRPLSVQVKFKGAFLGKGGGRDMYM